MTLADQHRAERGATQLEAFIAVLVWLVMLLAFIHLALLLLYGHHS